MAIEYIGHKEQHLRRIVDTVVRLTGGASGQVADLFCGTGCVSGGFKAAGYKVIANDTLSVCVRMAETVLLNSGPPHFVGLQGKYKKLPNTSSYESILAALNAAPPRVGFITQTYSPLAQRYGGTPRRYFTEANAMKIDGIRSLLKKWEPMLARGENALLISDLIMAANAVSNVAGVYGGFLRNWKKRATDELSLKPRTFVCGSRLGHQVLSMDATDLAESISPLVVYADPPYTKRQYAAYYHLPETVAIGDTPKVDGRTGLRPWAAKSSRWCHKRFASNELNRLVSRVRAPFMVLSYSEDGQIPHAEIVSILQCYGKCSYTELPARRYKAAGGVHKGPTALERLYVLRRKA